MRLLIATHARGPIGGVEGYLRGVVPGLAARGLKVGLLFEQRHEPDPSGADDPYGVCAAEWDAGSLGESAAVAAAQAWQPDAIWQNGVRSLALEEALLALAPAAITLHDYNRSCVTGEKFHRWPYPVPCHRRAGAGCLALNFARNCGGLRPARLAAGWHRQRHQAALVPRYRRVMTPSHYMGEEAHRQFGPGLPLEVMVYPMLQPRGGAPAPRVGVPSRLLLLARLTANKGGAHLIAAVHSARQQLGRPLHLTIAGDGPERRRLEQLSRRWQLNVSFPGWVGAEARRHLLEQTDLVAVPSLWPEGLGMAGFEAVAASVPAVAFDLGGIREWLQPGENGELAPATPPEVAGLAAAIVRALRDPSHWEQLRLGAWRQAERLQQPEHCDRLLAIFQGAAGEAHV